ncbi:chromatin assembly factor 1 subunit A-like [Denticeps clupeoides]|uniref:chromatin assembly factor 1 subunit A-like n=1 Tax=Denticeps clupeoides TaxID=299321 RepID=UPI0010A3239B|nr:chromatin assembly factor 1 subunit A-like [Denticeps clupeoides]XP_028821264.1 chromatin assembly factor 1 subunit A-like [Denticeps clupeoides]
MVVVMLAADGPLASTPRRRGMDCRGKKTTAKKLIQARLPFKRLNPEPKEDDNSKRTRGPRVFTGPDNTVSDGENEPSLAPLGPALVNGRGPLDCFMSRGKQTHIASVLGATIDLTEDSNSADAAKLVPTVPTLTSCPVADARPAASEVGHGIPDRQEANDHDEKQPPLQDITMESDMEDGDTEVSHGNDSTLSLGSTSSLSTKTSSPECTKPATPSDTTEKTDTEQKKVKRRSLKSLQEQEEKEKKREERERQREEAKAAKEKKKEEARKLKEEKHREKKERKEKEEREKREKKERDDKEKAEKLRVKEEQRKSKQEAKLEEKRKKDEEKRLKEEKDRIKAEKAEITRFLQKSKTQIAPKTLASACGKFAPFEIKEHMHLAPLCRVQCEEAVLEELDHYLAKPDSSLNGLKDWTRQKPRRSGPTAPRSQDSLSKCLVIGSRPQGVPDRQLYSRMKLLQFHENYRPAYWGTWSKKSCSISPRCPLSQDKKLLDYEVDSDEEWEEEEPGESLSHSEGDDDDEVGDDDDDDDGFFVPHGYLSDGEGALEEEDGGDLEKQKVRQKLKAREWDELISKKKVKVLETVVFGCVWEGETQLSKVQLELLLPHAVCILDPLHREEPSTPESTSQERNEELLSLLLPLLHGNVNSSKVIITEFQELMRQKTQSPSSPQSFSLDSVPTRVGLKRLIKENAVYEKRSTCRRCCWYVNTDVLARFNQASLPVPCQWNYLTPGAQLSRGDTPVTAGSQGNLSSTTPSDKRKSGSSMSITKFMKKCGEKEQTETVDTDGFQADTEDDEDEGDCIIIGVQESPKQANDATNSAQPESTEEMDVTPSDPSVLPVSCPNPATAKA